MDDALTPKVADPLLVRTLWFVTLEWLLLNVLGMITLDGGREARVTLICTLAYVAGLALFVARRGALRPTRLQRGILLALPVASVIVASQLAMLFLDR